MARLSPFLHICDRDRHTARGTAERPPQAKPKGGAHPPTAQRAQLAQHAGRRSRQVATGGEQPHQRLHAPAVHQGLRQADWRLQAASKLAEQEGTSAHMHI